ncbi:hypothetical protein [Kineococcus terrestris]|uniref:hypothetical protein n=1 Tax=Kineococcus terrestris TaxID=2044856 RepID=UPI0034DAE83C
MSTTTVQRPRTTARRPGPLATTVAAWSSAALVATGFAFVATAPIAVVAAGAWRDPQLGPARVWVTVLATAQATLLLVWRTADDPERSLTRSLDPVVAGAVVLVAVGTAVTCHVQRRRSRLAQGPLVQA